MPVDAVRYGIAAAVTSDAPMTLVSKMRRQVSASVSTMRTSGLMAGVYTTLSMPPSASAALSMADRHDASSSDVALDGDRGRAPPLSPRPRCAHVDGPAARPDRRAVQGRSQYSARGHSTRQPPLSVTYSPSPVTRPSQAQRIEQEWGGSLPVRVRLATPPRCARRRSSSRPRQAARQASCLWTRCTPRCANCRRIPLAEG